MNPSAAPPGPIRAATVPGKSSEAVTPPTYTAPCGANARLVASSFIAQLRAGDARILRTSRVGGRDRDQITSLALDAAGNLFATGYTMSADFPLGTTLNPALEAAPTPFC
jgi:hypothetical protein